MSTKQETFDRAAQAIIKQRGPSVDANHQCLYRGPNGLKCAAGEFIPDAQYDKTLEGQGVSYIREHIEPGHDIYLLEALQEAHDQAAARSRTDFMNDWLDEMNLVAAEFGLNIEVLREARA